MQLSCIYPLRGFLDICNSCDLTCPCPWTRDNLKENKLILNSYSGCDELSIRCKSKAELEDAVIRMFSLATNQFSDGDSYHGEFLLPDDLADAFRYSK